MRSQNDCEVFVSDLERHIERLRSCGIDTLFVHPLKARVSDRPDNVIAGDESSNRETMMLSLRSRVRECVKCGLHKTRTNTVFSDGDMNADIVFVGEAPGGDEDREGIPFVGRAGKLLDKMLATVGIRRNAVYICNILKCRPPENRNPTPEEVEMCSPLLEEQLNLLSPKVIVALGAFAAEFLTGSKNSVAKMREMDFFYRGTKVIVTYHPAAALRDAKYKKDLLDDLSDLIKEVEVKDDARKE